MALREDRMTWLGSMVRVMVQVNPFFDKPTQCSFHSFILFLEKQRGSDTVYPLDAIITGVKVGHTQTVQF